MVFVADDLGAWLVGLLADAGRKKLTTFVLGTDQERALGSAATAAVRLTAEELRPDDDEQAEHLSRVISQVFSEPIARRAAGRTCDGAGGTAGPDCRRALAALDDPGLTGAGQSSADVLGLSGTVVAAKLTSHLLHEIVVIPGFCRRAAVPAGFPAQR